MGHPAHGRGHIRACPKCVSHVDTWLEVIAVEENGFLTLVTSATSPLPPNFVAPRPPEVYVYK